MNSCEYGLYILVTYIYILNSVDFTIIGLMHGNTLHFFGTFFRQVSTQKTVIKSYKVQLTSKFCVILKFQYILIL